MIVIIIICPEMSTVELGGAMKRCGNKGEHDVRILNAIRQVVRAANLESRRLAARHDVTATQLVALMAVVEKGAVTAHDIACRIHVGASTLVGVLDRLEAKDLIRRQRRATDRREIEITASPAGCRLVSVTPPPLQHALNRALSRLAPSERERLARSLERLVTNLGAGDIDDSPVLEISAVQS
jgi:DNA-binding MarR family transcriptional regulator